MRKYLGLKDRDIMALRAHLSVLPSGPLTPGELNLSFMKVSEILSRACAMDERRFNRAEVRLEEVGLVLRRLSANGRRFPERDTTGQIVRGYGIDLNPLLMRLDELSDIRDRLEVERLALRQKRNHVSARFYNFIRGLYGLGTELPQQVAELKERLRNMLRRKSTTLEELDAIEMEVAELETSCPIEAAQLDDVECHGLDSADSAQEIDQTSVPGTGLQHVETAVDARQTVRQIESKPKDINKDKSREFEPFRISLLWQDTQMLQTFYPEPPSRERDAAGILLEFSSYIGLGQQVILRALSIFGWDNLIKVIDYLAERAERLKHPDGYLCMMVKCFEQGQPVAGGRVLPARLPRNHTVV